MSNKRRILKVPMEWYHRGKSDMAKGRPYAPPNDKIERRMYQEGYADEIMGVDTSEEDLMLLVQG